MNSEPALLIDNALSPRLGELLRSHGIDAVHLRELTRPDAADEAVLQLAREHGRVLVSFDTDFGGLLATTSANNPSVILFRTLGRRQTTSYPCSGGTCPRWRIRSHAVWLRSLKINAFGFGLCQSDAMTPSDVAVRRPNDQ